MRVVSVPAILGAAATGLVLAANLYPSRPCRGCRERTAFAGSMALGADASAHAAA